ncbi:hypothetical protein O9929_18515 [Vibrio lentus]|nr:hypothetical protein [Vibrio lentus]
MVCLLCDSHSVDECSCCDDGVNILFGSYGSRFCRCCGSGYYQAVVRDMFDREDFTKIIVVTMVMTVFTGWLR